MEDPVTVGYRGTLYSVSYDSEFVVDQEVDGFVCEVCSSAHGSVSVEIFEGVTGVVNLKTYRDISIESPLARTLSSIIRKEIEVENANEEPECNVCGEEEDLCS